MSTPKCPECGCIGEVEDLRSGTYRCGAVPGYQFRVETETVDGRIQYILDKFGGKVAKTKTTKVGGDH